MTSSSDSHAVLIPLRWSARRRLLRCFSLSFFPLIVCLLLPTPLLFLGAIPYFLGIIASGVAAILIVKRRLENEEKNDIHQNGPFLRITPTHIHFPEPLEPKSLALGSTRIEHWRLPYRYRHKAGTSEPPAAFVRLEGAGHKITLIGQDNINLEPFPLLTHKESLAKTAGTHVVVVDPVALLRAHPFLLARARANRENKQAAAARSAAPEEPASWMKWGLSAAENQALIAAGADVHARDAEGRNALAHQANPPANTIGYAPPDFAALQVLLDAGIDPPDAATAAEWKSRAQAQVTSALEQMGAAAFAQWLDRLLRD